MTHRVLAAAGFLALLAAQDPPKDPEQIYADKIQTLFKTLARKHCDNGGFCATKKQHQWAFNEYTKALDFEPDNSTARQKLGFKKDGEQWQKDPNAKVKTTNEETDEGKAEQAGLDFTKRLKEMGTAIGKLYVEAAKYAAANKLDEKSEESWKSALLYDPDSADARKHAGFEKVKPSADLGQVKWQTPKMTELMKAMRAAIAAAPKGDEATVEMFCDKVGVALKKRKSEHFVMGAPHYDQARLSILIQNAEATNAMFSKLLGMEDKSVIGNPVQSVIYKDKTEHEKYVDTFETDPRQKELAKKCSGSIGIDAHEKYEGDSGAQVVEDHVVHSTTHSLVGMHCGPGRSWINEGMAYIMTRGIKGTALSHCTALRDTSVKGAQKNFDDAEKWRTKIHELVDEMADPPIDAVMKASTAELSGAKTVKGWSLLEYMMHDHPEKFVEFLNELGRTGKEDDSGAEALHKAFDWTPQELDERWRAYVRTTYP